MTYRAQHQIIIDYDRSDAEDATRLLHSEFLSLVNEAITRVKNHVNKANFYFKIKTLRVESVGHGFKDSSSKTKEGYKSCLSCYHGRTGTCLLFNLIIDEYDTGTCHEEDK